MTENQSESLAISHNLNVNEIDQNFTKHLNKIRHKAFSKCLKRKTKLTPVISDLMKEKAMTQNIEAKDHLDQQMGKEIIIKKTLN